MKHQIGGNALFTKDGELDGRCELARIIKAAEEEEVEAIERFRWMGFD